MNFRVLRINSQKDYSQGVMFGVNNYEFEGGEQIKQLCYTLEDESRVVKVAKETRIPSGRYLLSLRTEGNLTKKYQARFPEIHKGMIWLQDVPNFVYIYIHCGNDDEDTSGCVLIGESLGKGTVLNSRSAYRKVYPIIRDSIKDGKTYLEVVDYDTPPEVG